MIPIFSSDYYVGTYPDVRDSGLDPVRHFLERGAAEGRKPHPLFDTPFYLKENPEVAQAGLNPLLHFLDQGAAEGRRPNPFFDPEFYLWRYQDVLQEGANPLEDYIQNWRLGRDPSPLFGNQFYLTRHPDVARAGMDPLQHYIEFGQGEGREINFPLVYRPGRVISAPKASTPRTGPATTVPVFCVYGPANKRFMEENLIPALARQDVPCPVELHLLNYATNECLFSPVNQKGNLARIRDWSAGRKPEAIGFGEGMNQLFEAVRPQECFLMVNPDSLPMPFCLRNLMATYVRTGAAIVEARQWPSEHPKEYDPETGYTPWASGAFCLLSSAAFRELKGFDPHYHLYLEDVDLSWRAWLGGFQVVYEPKALCAHFTGLLSYQPDRYYPEHFFSLRNFLVISYKYFGELGERVALSRLGAAGLPEPLRREVLESFYALKPRLQIFDQDSAESDRVTILGLNVFHRMSAN